MVRKLLAITILAVTLVGCQSGPKGDPGPTDFATDSDFQVWQQAAQGGSVGTLVGLWKPVGRSSDDPYDHIEFLPNGVYRMGDLRALRPAASCSVEVAEQGAFRLLDGRVLFLHSQREPTLEEVRVIRQRGGDQERGFVNKLRRTRIDLAGEELTLSRFNGMNGTTFRRVDDPALAYSE